MYYDSVGFPTSLHSVKGFDESMTCSVKLQNGCVRSQAEPSELIVVDSIGGIKSILRDKV